MRIKFLVLFAVICLSLHHASAHGKGHAEHGKPEAKAEKPRGKPEIIEVEEVEVVKHHRKEAEKHHTEKKTQVVHVKKEVKKKEHKHIPCAERVQDDKVECETKNVPKGYKGVFTYKDNEDCEWECNYEALAPPPTAKPEAKKKVVKVLKEKPQKPLKKECSGERKIVFNNCLVKIRGLIAWGEKAKRFDNRFNKLFHGNKKAKKQKQKKGGPKKGGPKKGGPKGGPK